MNCFDKFFLFSKTTSLTYGIISAALNILTVSPTLISLDRIYSALFNVAAETTEPDNSTGFKFAT